MDPMGLPKTHQSAVFSVAARPHECSSILCRAAFQGGGMFQNLRADIPPSAKDASHQQDESIEIIFLSIGNP